MLNMMEYGWKPRPEKAICLFLKTLPMYQKPPAPTTRLTLVRFRAQPPSREKQRFESEK